jgi:plasmid stabilization system protein ParE
MAQKEVIWTSSAIRDRVEIFQYWAEHNKSDHFSRKLEQLFSEAARLIAVFPGAGAETDLMGVRVKVVRTYKLFYIVQDSAIVIIRVWDARQDPEKFTTRR